MTAALQTNAHSGGLNKQGCHAGSQPYHCHKAQKAAPKETASKTILNGTVTHVRDGDTIVVDGIPIRLSALDCPEKGTDNGDYATQLAEQSIGLKAICELTGAKTYDRLVGYCIIDGADFGQYMIDNSSCTVWKKYDVWDKYKD